MRARITDQSSSLGLQREEKTGSKWKRWAGLSLHAHAQNPRITYTRQSDWSMRSDPLQYDWSMRSDPLAKWSDSCLQIPLTLPVCSHFALFRCAVLLSSSCCRCCVDIGWVVLWCTSRLPTESLCLYVQTPLRTNAFTYKSLYPRTYYFSTTLAMRAALKSKRTTLLALLSFPRAIWPVPWWRAAWHDSWAKFPEREGVWGFSRRPQGVQWFQRYWVENVGNDLAPLPCQIGPTSSRYSGPIRVTSLERCRASFEHSLLDLFLQQFFPGFKHPSFTLQC